jgi:hypothetical protein
MCSLGRNASRCPGKMDDQILLDCHPIGLEYWETLDTVYSPATQAQKTPDHN